MDSPRLNPLLLANKTHFSLSMKHLYQEVNWIVLYDGSRVLNTPLSSVNGTAPFSYHKTVVKFDIHENISLGATLAALQVLLDAFLVSGNLKSLVVGSIKDLRHSEDANLSRLQCLRVLNLSSSALQVWLQQMLPRQGAEFNVSPMNLPFAALRLQSNTK